MRSMIASIALILSGAATAETITLGSETCTATNICYSVPNDKGITIDYLSNATQYHRLIISIDGTLYDSGVGNAVGYPVYLYDGAGQQLVASLSWTVIKDPCMRSGRVTVCPVHVTLNGGTLTR